MFSNTSHVCILGAGKTGQSVATFLSTHGISHILHGDANDIHMDWDGITHIIQSPGIPLTSPVSKMARDKNIPIYSDIDVFRSHIKHAKIIGITGTNGKSTTTALITHMLKTLGLDVYMGGNIGVPALSLPIHDAPDTVYVLELSSYQLEISGPLHLDTGVLINISEDHLERHGTMDQYICEKMKIFDGAKRGIICTDDAYCQKIAQTIRDVCDIHPSTVSTGDKNITLWDPQNEDQGTSTGTNTSVSGKTISFNGHGPLRGRHNLQNVGVAITIGLKLGFDEHQILSAIQTFPGLPHRQNMIYDRGDLVIVNDSKATNADAAAKALDAYADHDIFWIVGGQPKKDGITPLRSYFSNISHAFTFGAAADDFYTILKNHHVPVSKYATVDLCLESAKNMILNNNYYKKCVILFSPACASFDQFQNFETRGEHFCQIVKDLFHDA